MTDCIQITTTAGSQDEAQRIARALVERRLAACVQVLGPISSTYQWQGGVETSEEWMCLVKTRQTHYAAVDRTIRDLHSYDVPEILAVPIVAGSSSYLEWLSREVTGSEIT